MWLYARVSVCTWIWLCACFCIFSTFYNSAHFRDRSCSHLYWTEEYSSYEKSIVVPCLDFFCMKIIKFIGKIFVIPKFKALGKYTTWITAEIKTKWCIWPRIHVAKKNRAAHAPTSKHGQNNSKLFTRPSPEWVEIECFGHFEGICNLICFFFFLKKGKW